jgi:hypothetical protein
MRAPASRFTIPLLAAALLLGFAAKQAFDYTDTTWDFASAKLTFSAKAKKIGHLKGSQVDIGQVVLHADGSWTLVYQGNTVASGTWTVKDAFSKTVEATLDPTGQQQVFEFVATAVENQALALGQPSNVTLDTVKVERVRLTVKPDVKHGTATAKLVASCTLTGLADSGPFTNEPAVCKAKIVGTSNSVPLASIEP